MSKQFIVWGIAQGFKDETVLISEKANLKTYNDALNAISL